MRPFGVIALSTRKPNDEIGGDQMTSYLYTSLTRISNLREVPFTVEPLSRDHWETGDYVVGEVDRRPSSVTRIELGSGRCIEAMEGSLLIGAFGKRHATLEATGDWRDIEEDMKMEAIGGGGLMGKLTSRSPYMPPVLSLTYNGHVLVNGQKVNMRDFVPNIPKLPFNLPVILIVGTSMSAGKTTAARMIIRQLCHLNLKIVGAKLTGSGRYQDILGMRDAGASVILDFVDAGLPTTVCSEEKFKKALQYMLSRLAMVDADVAVLEAGASPLEPYNGRLAVELIEEHIRFIVACASDPYAIVGLMSTFGRSPDLVTGAAANTTAAIELVESLSGFKALNLMDREAQWELRSMLRESLGLNANRIHQGTTVSSYEMQDGDMGDISPPIPIANTQQNMSEI